MQNLGKWVLGISAVVHEEFPDDWDEAMGIVLGSAIEHVMASGLEGQITNRIRFAKALNSYGGAPTGSFAISTRNGTATDDRRCGGRL